MKKAMLLSLALVPSLALAGNAGDKPGKKQDGIVCRDVAETGSRLSSKRVCMTREQWEAGRRAARETVMQAQGHQSNPCGMTQTTC